MSVRVSSWVWEHSVVEHRGDLLVLLALADHARDDGSGAYPSVKTIGDRTRLSRRGVFDVLDRLKTAGAIERTGVGPKGTVSYRVLMNKGVQPLHGGVSSNGADAAPEAEGADAAPEAEGAATARGGADAAPEAEGAATARGGAAHCTGGVQPTAPEPSFNRPNNPLPNPLPAKPGKGTPRTGGRVRNRNGSTPRELGVNARALGTNPRALGVNARALQQAGGAGAGTPGVLATAELSPGRREQFEQLRTAAAAELPASTWQTWLGPLTAGEQHETIVLTGPDDSHVAWVRRRFGPLLQQLAGQHGIPLELTPTPIAARRRHE